MKSRPVFNALYQSMGVAGDPDDIGYFSNFGKGTAIAFNARIKSGLINNVRSHSGYVQDRSSRWIAFSFIANNYTGRLSNINNVHEKILIELASRK
jgi:D-alanyl-D-alanine carboxypeptidase